MANTYKDMACVVGVGETAYTRGTDKTTLELQLEAIVAACDDAGVSPKEIDGYVGGNAEDWAANLGGTDIKFSSVLHLGGANNVAAIEQAALALSNGLCNYVLIPSGGAGFTAGQRPRNATANVGAGISAAIGVRDYYLPFGVQAPPQNYALMAKRHMLKYGTKQEHLGAVAVAHRKHAQLHPNAMMRGTPMTMEDYLNSRWIVEPYHLLDCCLENDGAACILLTTAERARDLKQPPVYVMAGSQGSPYPAHEIPNRPDILFAGLDFAAPRAFRMAGVEPNDIDVVGVYDCFTFQVIMQLEAAGFCKKGEGGPFVEGGRIEIGGELPVNPHGGLLSQAHIAALNHAVELTRQLRHQADARQVRDAELAFLCGWGGHGHGAVSILRR